VEKRVTNQPTERLYTTEDIDQEAYLTSQEKGIPYAHARYFARMKRGRESIKLARGLEEHIETLIADEKPLEPQISVLYLFIVHELESRNLHLKIEEAACLNFQ
jgi:hypothetical protein